MIKRAACKNVPVPVCLVYGRLPRKGFAKGLAEPVEFRGQQIFDLEISLKQRRRVGLGRYSLQLRFSGLANSADVGSVILAVRAVTGAGSSGG